ncbi:MAG: hypothetical protein HRU75_03310 [Planctomycetia bacterium]|nr:MAG: hypothetical protein HRU75_03310 [Planctomycetia bacterium]
MNARTWVAVFLIVAIAGGCPVPSPMGQANGNSDGSNSNGNSNSSDAGSNSNSSDSSDDKPVKPLADPSVYGDGSAGERVVSTALRVGDQGDVNLQYTDFVVAPGVTMTVQSGTVIRCTGTFRNEGTILVLPGAEGGDRTGFDGSTLDGSSRPAALGIATRAAAAGEIGGSASGRTGGGEGSGLSEFEARQTLRIGVKAGGGGGASIDGGASGGGFFAVIAAGEIQNLGTIIAKGADATDRAGGGGGGGGAVLLASLTAVSNAPAGVVQVDGGGGGPATANSAAGGGGGGGIVHLIAPDVKNDGVLTALGGAPGADGVADSVVSDLRSGGGGGGASGGNGGKGGGVPAGSTATPSSASAGSNGHTLITAANPTALVK